MNWRRYSFNRRNLLRGALGGLTAFSIVPRNVLGRRQRPPSEELGGALIGCGGRGNGTFKGLGSNVRKLAMCDVKYKNRADNKTYYTDFRRVLERRDVDVVAVATPPGWHALISIAAMEAGKDVLCEKPMTRFIAEGRAVAAETLTAAGKAEDAKRVYDQVTSIFAGAEEAHIRAAAATGKSRIAG